MDKKIQWKTFEHEQKKRGVEWFYAVGIITTALTITAIIYKNILFAIFLIIGIFTLLLHSLHKPKLIQFEINEKGIIIGNLFYPYDSISSFYIFEGNDKKYFILELKKSIIPHIKIPITDNVDKNNIKRFLIKHIPEKEYQESVSEIIMDRLGF